MYQEDVRSQTPPSIPLPYIVVANINVNNIFTPNPPSYFIPPQLPLLFENGYNIFPQGGGGGDSMDVNTL